MRERELSTVLLIKAVEDADREGTLLPAADRAAATRDAARGRSEPSAAAGADVRAGPLSREAQRLLATRAQLLHARLAARVPVVDSVLTLAGGPWWLGALLLGLGLVVGFSLSALDGTRRINVLAFPLLGLVLWSLLVYLSVLVRRIRALARRTTRHSPIARLLAQTGLTRVRRLIARSAAFNAPLAGALGRFVGEWHEAVWPVLVARAARLLHLSAAAAGLGLIAGLYLRGLVLDYEAGWESTFLTAQQVHALLRVAYGPASLLTGIAIPGAAQLAAIRWPDGQGPRNAAPWIHLLAATAFLFVVLPRLALVLGTTLVVWRRSFSVPMPPSLAPYFRSVFGAAAGVVGRGIVAVMPYAYEPSTAASTALRHLIPATLGATMALDMRAQIRYGEEDDFLQHLPDRGGAVADVIALLFSLAATPEDQSHGIVIAGVRDWLAGSHRHAQMLVLVDERPYSERMGGQAGFAERLVARRAAWEAFVAARGLRACVLDLAPEPTTGADGGAVERLRAALWQPAPA
jgi:Protein of unknown function (DUF2868)